MNGTTANKVCQKCSGRGRWYEQDGINAVPVVCVVCNGTGTSEVFPSDTGITDRKMDMTQGCNHFDYSGTSGGTNTPVNGLPKSYGYDNRKTLLDEFAIEYSKIYTNDYVSAMHHGPSIDERLHMSEMSYQMAAAMMIKRSKRDEMGNIKEVTE